jgi:hypothetical protein
MAETLRDKFKRWTELATTARTFVLALVALVAALAALGTGIVYLKDVLRQISVNKEQTKAGVMILAEDISKVNRAAQQNHDDLVAVNEYLLSLGEASISQALPEVAVSAPRPRLPMVAMPPPPPQHSSGPMATAPTPGAASAAPPAPTASQGTPTKRRPPPQPGPNPEFIDPNKATDVFKP